MRGEGSPAKDDTAPGWFVFISLTLAVVVLGLLTMSIATRWAETKEAEKVVQRECIRCHGVVLKRTSDLNHAGNDRMCVGCHSDAHKRVHSPKTASNTVALHGFSDARSRDEEKL